LRLAYLNLLDVAAASFVAAKRMRPDVKAAGTPVALAAE
jgi:hypothetical protein